MKTAIIEPILSQQFTAFKQVVVDQISRLFDVRKGEVRQVDDDTLWLNSPIEVHVLLGDIIGIRKKENNIYLIDDNDTENPIDGFMDVETLIYIVGLFEKDHTFKDDK